MSTSKFLRQWIVALALLFMTSIAFEIRADSSMEKTGLGVPLNDEEVSNFAITVFPDGTGLPDGSGSVKWGAELYQRKCSVCHGEKGIEGPAARLAGDDGWASLSDPLRVLRIKKYPILLISVGGMWPHATSVYDYIRRAMPHYSPKSLTNDEVYALTGYLLFLNDLIDKEAVLSKDNIHEVEMPGRNRSVSAWGDNREGVNF